jgi:hypothetical protein
MRITLSNINKALKAKGYDVELIRGKEYFYFIGFSVESWKTTSVNVFHLTDLSVEEWVKEYERLKAEN